jgi:hypothetical protein
VAILLIIIQIQTSFSAKIVTGIIMRIIVKSFKKTLIFEGIYKDHGNATPQ